MRRRDFITLLGGATTWPLSARAQQSAMKHIGVLMDIAETDATAKKWVDAFETSLVALGWRKGRDCVLILIKAFRRALGELIRGQGRRRLSNGSRGAV